MIFSPIAKNFRPASMFAWGFALVLVGGAFASSPVGGSFWKPDVWIAGLSGGAGFLGGLMVLTSLVWSLVSLIRRSGRRNK
jgi:uncharacterized membrane protein